MANILIVDDSNTFAQSHAKMLEKQGHHISFAADGETAIEKAHADKPDLILMDLIMPGMNGFQATRKLSKDEETSGIPIIITSSKDQETDIVYGQRQGAVEYLVKPVDENTLVTAVNKALA